MGRLAVGTHIHMLLKINIDCGIKCALRISSLMKQYQQLQLYSNTFSLYFQ